jgi:hypothetical protein
MGSQFGLVIGPSATRPWFFHGKVPLVVAHHGNQDFPRQVKKARVKTPQHGARPFGGISDPIYQPFVLDDFAGSLAHHYLCFLNDAILDAG